jgi:hypothetical protein
MYLCWDYNILAMQYQFIPAEYCFISFNKASSPQADTRRLTGIRRPHICNIKLEETTWLLLALKNSLFQVSGRIS